MRFLINFLCKRQIKLLQMDNKRYPKSCFEMLRALDDVGRENRASSIRVLLYRYGFVYIGVAQEVGDIANCFSV